MKKKLMGAALAVAMAAQSTPVFADHPTTWGLCQIIPQWQAFWLPCFPMIPGQRNGQK